MTMERPDRSTRPHFWGRALVRRPGDDLTMGITTSPGVAVNLSAARAQHRAYVQALIDSGVEVTELPPLVGFPDAPFVEDTAVVTPRGAVITRPGAKARFGEQDSVRPALAQWLPTVELAAADVDACLDGGDVLRVDDRFIIGISSRTNQRGAECLAARLAAWGYTPVITEVRSGLHLKSLLTYLGRGVLLRAPGAVTVPELAGYDVIDVTTGDAHGANAVALTMRVLLAAGHPETAAAIRSRGFFVTELDMSEFRKLDGGLTCLSLLLPSNC